MESGILPPSDETIRAAYLYLLGRALVIRQERLDIRETPYNTVKYNPLGIESTGFVNPSMDVAYLEAWIAVDKHHAVILEVPEITDRYYTVQLTDGWGEVISNINPRHDPRLPYGKFAFVRQWTTPEVPDDARVIALPADKAKLVARVELSDTVRKALVLQHGFMLDVPSGIHIAPPPAFPDFPCDELPGPWMFDHVEEMLASCPDSMPDAPKLQLMAQDVAAWLRTGETARRRLGNVIDEQVLPYFYRTLMADRPDAGGWLPAYSDGRYGNQYEQRALGNYCNIWANAPEESIYYTAYKDAEGQALSGSRTYALRFPPDALPEAACAGFWSLTLLRMPDYRAVSNPLHRYSRSNASGAKPDADGSLTLFISPVLPDGTPPENFLPAPKDTPIVLTFRLYAPRHNALTGQWFVPPLLRLE